MRGLQSEKAKIELRPAALRVTSRPARRPGSCLSLLKRAKYDVIGASYKKGDNDVMLITKQTSNKSLFLTFARVLYIIAHKETNCIYFPTKKPDDFYNKLQWESNSTSNPA